MAFELPRISFPQAADVDRHGLGVARLPEVLPVFKAPQLTPDPSIKYNTNLNMEQSIITSNLIGSSFSTREPMGRHIQLSKKMPLVIQESGPHTDEFGTIKWDKWDRPTLYHFSFRLWMLTDPASPLEDVKWNRDVAKLSILAERDGEYVAACFTSTFTWPEPHGRENDPYVNGLVSGFFWPIGDLLMNQDKEATEALRAKYPDFKECLAIGKVAHLLTIGRSDKGSSLDAFRVFVAQLERLKSLDYKYCVVECSAEWTGAAAEYCNAQRVHFAPFRAKKVLKTESEAGDYEPYSSDGFISDKDSGCLFYVFKF